MNSVMNLQNNFKSRRLLYSSLLPHSQSQMMQMMTKRINKIIQKHILIYDKDGKWDHLVI